MEKCDGCGFVWDLVPHAEVAARIGETAARYRLLLLPADRPGGWRERVATRPAPVVWSALEYACHVRDVLFVQRDRVYSILVEDCPSFGPMHREERVELGRYGDEELSDVVDQLETGARMLARTVAVLTSEQFGRTGIYGYPAVGTRTLSWVAAQALHEMLHHADDITAQLAPHQGSLDLVRAAPSNQGTLELIVSRPDIDQREVLDAAVLDARQGLIGDSWINRGSRRTADGSADPEDQVNIMSASAARLLCGDRDRWAQAGDQLFVDFDLSAASLPAGSRLRIGEAVVEISARPHRGCAKFAERFGRDALRLVNSAEGRALNLRGVNAKIINGGTIRTGDRVSRSLPRQSGRGGVVED